MGKRIELEDAFFELEQTTATLGFIQTAFAEGASCINMKDASSAIFMLYRKQNEVLQKVKETLMA